MEINTTTIVLAIVVGLVVIGLLAALALRLQRTKRLRDQFGPEYHRTVERLGGKRRAEEELEERMAHVEFLNIRTLSAEDINRFALQWQAIQAEFVDQPLGAVQKANQMIEEVMRARGYPVDDFEQRVSDISVDHAELVTNYRELHEIATRGQNETITTEEMRQAMVHGRELFERLVQPNAKAEHAS